MLGKLPGEMHGAEGMLETAMFSGRINPAGALQLINIAQPLHPRRIDQRFFSDLALFLRYGKLNITMNRVGDQRRPFVFVIGYWKSSCCRYAVSVPSAIELRISRKLWPRTQLVKFRKSNVPSTDCRFFPCGSCEMRWRQFPVDLVAIRIDFFAGDFRFDDRVFNLANLKLF